MFHFRCVHFDDCETRERRKARDKFCHIREIFEHVVENFQKHYVPGENVTLDEQLVPFRGRCSFKQYIKSKPARYGIKVFAVVDSESWYTFNLEPYLGTQPSGAFQVDNSTKEVVMRLTKPIQGAGRNVTGDNWFTSVETIVELSKAKTSYVGTVRANKRQLPKEFLPKVRPAREVGSSLFGHTEVERCKITLVSYVPKPHRCVILASSLHNDNELAPSGKSDIIEFYNKTKCGVDVVDQMCANYSAQRKSNRWPLAIFANLINLAGINALVLYKLSQQCGIERSKFLLNLGNALVLPQINVRLSTRQVKYETKVLCRMILGLPIGSNDDSLFHLEKHVGFNKSQKCRLCLNEKIRKSAVSGCSNCKEAVCSSHYYKLCDECINSFQNRF